MTSADQSAKRERNTMPTLLQSLKSEWNIRSASASKEPLYHQLYLVLKNSITNGTVEIGAQMPTEQQLSETFELSRITVKRAMDELAADNLIARRRGKGSHVTYQYEPEPVKAPLVGMLENVEEMGKHSQVRVLSIDTLVPPATVRESLDLGASEKATRVVRVRSNENGSPYAYYVSWTLAPKGGFTKANIEKKTRLSILRESGIRISQVEQTLGAENADNDISSLLEVPVGAALLSLQRQSFDEDGKLIDILYGLYNPTLFTYRMKLGLD